MPLGDFLKGKKSQVINKIKGGDSSAVIRDEEAKKQCPLENISEELFSSEDGSLCDLFPFGAGERHSSFGKTCCSILSNPNALGYFIQFMSSRDSESLVKFCLDVQSFKTCSKFVSTKYLEAGQTNSSEKVPCDTTTCDTDKKPSNLSKENGHEFYDEIRPASPSTTSVDSGINDSRSDPLFSPISLNDDGFLQSFPGESNAVSDLEDNSDPLAEENIINQTKDAMAIYQKYVAPESPMEIEFPLIVKHSIVTGICSESGLLDTSCFDSALEFVTEKIDSEHFQDFLRSEYHAKHLVDILSQDGGRNLTIVDIIENEVLLFHFMEFLDKTDSRNSGALLEFWISASNLRQQCTTLDVDLSFLRDDVFAIYDKFVSESATSPLGFSESIRLSVKNSICRPNERIPHTVFDEALSLVLRVLHMRFVQKFINSQPFKNYITELTTAISSSTLNSKKDSSISFSPSTPKNSQPISCQNTLLASASSKNRPQRTSDPNFLDLCAEADHLWRRKSNSITNIGYVDDLGRYKSDFDAPPDSELFVGNQPMGKKLSQVMRRIITKNAVEKGKEELAWQMAAMIVKDVVSRKVHDSRNSSVNCCKDL